MSNITAKITVDNITVKIGRDTNIAVKLSPYGGGGNNKASDHQIVKTGNWANVMNLTSEVVEATAIISEQFGTPPLTFTTTGNRLLDYIIYGSQNGVGDYVGGTLFDAELVQGAIDRSTGIPRTTDTTRMHSEPLTPLPAGTYSFSVDKSSSAASTGMQAWVFVYDSEGTYVTYEGIYNFPFTYTLSADRKIRLNICYTNDTTILPEHIESVTLVPVGANAPTITDGYAIPVNVSADEFQQAVALLVDKPLGSEHSISLSDTNVGIPTKSGSENTLTFGTAAQPSGVYIRFKS